MKVLDRYIVRELLIPIVCSCVTLVFLILIADLFDNLDDLIRHHTPIQVIFRYYLALTPHAFIQVIPWSAWLGTLFLLVNLGFHNETTAMKAAGIKIITIVKPILFLGFLIGMIAFLVSDRIVPSTLRTATELRETYIEESKKKEPEKIFENVTYFSGGDQIYYFRKFLRLKNEVQGVIILWLEHQGSQKNQKMVANRGRWKENGWEFEGVTEYQMDSRGRILGEPRTFPKKHYPEIRFSPEELTASISESSFLSYRDLKGWIRKLKQNGVRVQSEIVDLHSRLAAPWQALVMMLITIPLLAHTTNRKLIAMNVLICVGLIFVYHVTGAVGLALGKAGKIFPFLGAWISNMIFAVGALSTLDKANY